MQQVMLHTLSKLRAGELREPERVLSFVLGTCRLTVMDQRRGERRRAELLERFADDLPVAEGRARRAAARRGPRRRLPRAAARARAGGPRDDLLRRAPSEAVGSELGLSAGNVRVIRHRGIDKLRRCVDAAGRLAA
jgi:RNA polymerase sigma-70 factor (ECF subfamily)